MPHAATAGINGLPSRYAGGQYSPPLNLQMNEANKSQNSKQQQTTLFYGHNRLSHNERNQDRSDEEDDDGDDDDNDDDDDDGIDEDNEDDDAEIEDEDENQNVAKSPIIKL